MGWVERGISVPYQLDYVTTMILTDLQAECIRKQIMSSYSPSLSEALWLAWIHSSLHPEVCCVVSMDTLLSLSRSMLCGYMNIYLSHPLPLKGDGLVHTAT